MKHILLTLSCAVGLSLSASAVSFDTEGFGAALNGWNKKRIASYSIDNHSYRTHQPTITPAPGGGIFLSTRVDHCPVGRKPATSYIELAFSGGGELLSGQIRVQMGDVRLNTGQVMRAPEAAPAPEGAEPVANLEPWKTPTMQIVTDLFAALDTELGKLTKAEAEGKKDMFARIFGTGYRTADLAAALRHNLNLALHYVR